VLAGLLALEAHYAGTNDAYVNRVRETGAVGPNTIGIAVEFAADDRVPRGFGRCAGRVLL
jgi:hypothetical protein